MNMLHQSSSERGPVDSPSPIVGLSRGVAFLNPILPERNRDTRMRFQHPHLRSVGAPYVYNVAVTDVDSVLEAAESSARHRFSSYIPPNFRVSSMLDRVCTMLKDESMCAV